MKKFILAIAVALVSSATHGQLADTSGYKVIDGRIHLMGKFQQLSGIQVISEGKHLSLDSRQVPGVGEIPLKLPFDNRATVVDNQAGQVVMGVLGADRRIDVAGNTPTSILYAGTDAQADLKVVVGLGDDGLVELQRLSGSSIPANQMPKHIMEALKQMTGQWAVETVVDGVTKVSEVDIEWAIEGSALRIARKGADAQGNMSATGTGIMGWDAARKLVVEYEINADGTTSHATHHVSQDGTWLSPISGIRLLDGKQVFYEEERVIEFKSNDEWTIVAATVSEKSSAVTSTFRRKKTRR